MASSLQYWDGSAWMPVNSQVDLCNQTLGTGGLTADAWGSQKVSLPYSIFHGMFTFDVPPTSWFMYHNGTQVYTSTNIVSNNGAGEVTTSATNTTCLLESRQTPRYQPNRGHLFSTACWLPGKTLNGIRDFGLFTAENGVFFRLKADGLLYAVLRSGGVETKEELIDTSGVTAFDVEKGNVYDIQYQWRGVGNYKFFINLTEVKVFANLGTLTALSMEDPALPAAFKSVRTTQDVSLFVGCADITSENGNDDRLQYRSVYANRSRSGTNLPLLIVESPLQINSRTNTRVVELARITVNSDKKATFKVWTTRDPTAFTAATFNAIGNGSYLETDIVATAVDTAKMQLITDISVLANATVSIDNPFQTRIDFPIVRGDHLVITVTATTADCDVVVEFGEAV